MPNKHLIAQQICGDGDESRYLLDYPAITLHVAQYLWWNPNGFQVGGLMMLDREYHRNVPVEINETNWYPNWYEGDPLGASRTEAWEFMVGGGSAINHLNGLFTTVDPAGNTPENEKVLVLFRNLKRFLDSFDFVKMRRDTTVICGGIPPGAHARAISELGRQYALYIHHSSVQKQRAYIVTPGNFHEYLQLNIPKGSYVVTWIDPQSAAVLREERISHSGGILKTTTPAYSVDIAARIVAD